MGNKQDCPYYTLKYADNNCEKDDCTCDLMKDQSDKEGEQLLNPAYNSICKNCGFSHERHQFKGEFCPINETSNGQYRATQFEQATFTFNDLLTAYNAAYDGKAFPFPAASGGEERSQDELFREIIRFCISSHPTLMYAGLVEILKSKYIIKRK